MNWSVKIWKYVNVWIRDDKIKWWFEVGDYTWLSSRNLVYSSDEFKVKIWKFCSIADGATFIAAMWHDYQNLTTYRWHLKPEEFKNVWASIEIWNDVWIWKNAIIMKWVKIWTWAVIWAWSVVTKDVPQYAIVAWNPAKVIKYRFDNKTIKKILESKRRNRDIQKIKENYNLEFIKK